MESEKSTLNTHTQQGKGKGREVPYKHECCWQGICRVDFGKSIQRFKGGKSPKPKSQT